MQQDECNIVRTHNKALSPGAGGGEGASLSPSPIFANCNIKVAVMYFSSQIAPESISESLKSNLPLAWRHVHLAIDIIRLRLFATLFSTM